MSVAEKILGLLAITLSVCIGLSTATAQCTRSKAVDPNTLEARVSAAVVPIVDVTRNDTVVGVATLVHKDGYFVSAGHIFNTHNYKDLRLFIGGSKVAINPPKAIYSGPDVNLLRAVGTASPDVENIAALAEKANADVIDIAVIRPVSWSASSFIKPVPIRRGSLPTRGFYLGYRDQGTPVAAYAQPLPNEAARKSAPLPSTKAAFFEGDNREGNSGAVMYDGAGRAFGVVAGYLVPPPNISGSVGRDGAYRVVSDDIYEILRTRRTVVVSPFESIAGEFSNFGLPSADGAEELKAWWRSGASIPEFIHNAVYDNAGQLGDVVSELEQFVISRSPMTFRDAQELVDVLSPGSPAPASTGNTAPVLLEAIRAALVYQLSDFYCLSEERSFANSLSTQIKAVYGSSQPGMALPGPDRQKTIKDIQEAAAIGEIALAMADRDLGPDANAYIEAAEAVFEYTSLMADDLFRSGDMKTDQAAKHFYGLAKTYRLAGDLGVADALNNRVDRPLERAVALDPSNTTYLIALGQSSAIQGSPGLATQFLARADLSLGEIQSPLQAQAIAREAQFWWRGDRGISLDSLEAGIESLDARRWVAGSINEAYSEVLQEATVGAYWDQERYQTAIEAARAFTSTGEKNVSLENSLIIDGVALKSLSPYLLDALSASETVEQ